MSDELDTSNLEAELVAKYGAEAVAAEPEEIKEVEASSEETVAEEASIETEEPEGETDSEEMQARSNGWDPSKGTLTAREFNMRGEFIGQLKENQEQIKKLHQTITKMTVEQQAREDVAREAEIRAMEQRRQEAVELGDVEAFNAAEEKINAARSGTEAEGVTPEVNEFLTRNASWFNDDSIENYEMKQHALLVDDFLAKKNPTAPDAERLKAVELEVKRRFASRFTNAKQEAPPAVSSSKRASKGTAAAASMDLADLTSGQRALYEQACKGQIPGMSGKEYLKSLAQINQTGRT